MITGDQVLIKWLSISEGDESYSEAVKEDACNWIKKATSESNINIYKLLLCYSKNPINTVTERAMESVGIKWG